MHDKVLTAHNLIKRNWDCNYNYSMFLCLYETTEHLLTQCNYVEAAWNIIAPRNRLSSYAQMPRDEGATQWVRHNLKTGTKEKKEKLGALFIFWWWVWKERNNRIFRNEEVPAQRLGHLILAEICLQRSVLVPATS
jgi:hypothetical protein